MLQCIGKICVLGLVSCLLAFLFVYKGFYFIKVLWCILAGRVGQNSDFFTRGV